MLADLFGDDRHYKNIKRERLWRIWFYVWAYGIYMFAVIGVGLFITIFLVSYPVCFSPLLVGAEWVSRTITDYILG